MGLFVKERGVVPMGLNVRYVYLCVNTKCTLIFKDGEIESVLVADGEWSWVISGNKKPAEAGLLDGVGSSTLVFAGFNLSNVNFDVAQVFVNFVNSFRNTVKAFVSLFSKFIDI